MKEKTWSFIANNITCIAIGFVVAEVTVVSYCVGFLVGRCNR